VGQERPEREARGRAGLWVRLVWSSSAPWSSAPGRYGEIQGDTGRCREMQGGTGKYREIQGAALLGVALLGAVPSKITV
jgi:hypothetical protein